MMDCIENTPSVYFTFEDTAKRTQLSEEAFFQLSCTNQKEKAKMPLMFNLKPVPLNLNVEVEQNEVQSKVKTQQFFEQFEKNFVVTFEEDHKMTSQVSLLAEHSRQETTDPDNETISKISLSHCRNSQESKDEDLKSRVQSEERTKNTLQKDEKTNSPIPSFEVKKRTVFKSKRNIQENAQNFKLTKKKIYNKDTLEILKISCNSCKIGELEKPQSSLFLTLKVWKAGDLDQQLIARRKHKSTIFQRDEKQNNRDYLRSTTLQNWKKKFQKKKAGLEKTIKRSVNIFMTKPSSHI